MRYCRYARESDKCTESQNIKQAGDTYETLFNEQTEQDCIANLTERLEHFGPQVWILDHVIELSQVVAQHTCNSDDHR